MAEENTAGDAGSNGDGAAFEPITSQDQLNRLIGDRINQVKSRYADYDQLKDKAAKFDQADQASKTELQKLTDERDLLIKERDGLKLGQLRLDVGAAKGLTPGQSRRLIGTTQQELESDADVMLAELQPERPKPDPKRLRSGSSSDDRSSGKDRAAAALRQLRAG